MLLCIRVLVVIQILPPLPIKVGYEAQAAVIHDKEIEREIVPSAIPSHSL